MCLLVFSMSKSNIEEIRSDAQSRFSCVKLVTSELVLTIYNACTQYTRNSVASTTMEIRLTYISQ